MKSAKIPILVSSGGKPGHTIKSFAQVIIPQIQSAECSVQIT
jgi:hypothetical protein